MRKIDRFLKYLEYKGITENKATKECGLSQGLLHQAKTGKSDLGYKTIDKILDKYQDINDSWLLHGEGEMIKDNINENQIDLNISDMKDFIKTIREEQKMLAEALSQNSRLIGIIERMQGISESNVSSTPPPTNIYKKTLYKSVLWGQKT